MKFVSLFAGIGGFDLGLERAGMTCVGQCEIDPHAHAVLDRHWPNVPKHDDVTTLEADTFGPADVITFGSPCQDLSVAGKRAGLDGERSGLFLEAVRYIRDMLEETNGRSPRFAVWENVPGAYSSNGGADFAAVLASLVGGEVRRPSGGWANAGVAFGPLGSAEWRTLDSQYFGVPQRRRRIFLVYHPGGERAGQVLLEPDGVPGHSPQSGTAGARVAGAVTSGLGSGEPLTFINGFNGRIGTLSNVAPTLVGSGEDDRGIRNALVMQPSDAIAFEPRAYTRGVGSPASDATRAEPGLPVGTLAANSDPHIATSYAVRRLLPVECERLQGFPDGHTELGHYMEEIDRSRLWNAKTRTRPKGEEAETVVRLIADTHRYRMLGNAVTVPVIEWIGHRIKAVAA